MKHLITGFCILIFTHSLFAQDLNTYKNAIGIDAINSLAALLGSFDHYDVLEIGYVRRMEETDLRIKFNFNANDQNEDRMLQNKFIDEEERFKFNSNYRSSSNLLLSLGIAKRIQKGKRHYYVGVDAFSGIDIGHTTSAIWDNLEELESRLLGRQKSVTYNVGITPVVGTKIPLHGRISLALEFGLPMRLETGSIGYIDETEVQRKFSIDGYRFRFDQLLNDLRISYNF